jgi:hypothetical protein
LGSTDQDHVPRNERPITGEWFASHDRPVAAADIPHFPSGGDRDHLGMEAARTLVMEHDTVGRPPADRACLARVKTDHGVADGWVEHEQEGWRSFHRPIPH